MGRAERNRRADELMARLGLADRGGDKVDSYSGGMAQRLLIARALMHRPSVLFLDEPSTGLDPHSRAELLDNVREVREAGTTVVLSTHDLAEADAVCDRIVVIDAGRIVADGPPADLKRALGEDSTLEDVFAALTRSDAEVAA